MNITAPYHIKHLYLHQTVTNPYPLKAHESYYFIVWWHHVALGDFYITPDHEATGESFAQKIISAIDGTLHHYVPGKKENGQQFIADKNLSGWVQWASSHLPMPVTHMPHTVAMAAIICTHNRPQQLKLCLQQLQALQCKPAEIIVVDNAPTDDATFNCVKEFPDITYVKEPRTGLDLARNTGILTAKAPVVAFIDDDVVIHPLCIYQIWKTFEKEDAAAMTGLVFPLHLATEAQVMFEKWWTFNRGYVPRVYDTTYLKAHLNSGPPVWEIGAGANMAFRKSALQSVGLFDELLGAGAAGCNDDSEMWFRLLAGGHKIYYNPLAIVYHDHRNTKEALKKQVFNYMRGHAVAALIQQTYYKEANYKKHVYQNLPKKYITTFFKNLRYGRSGVEIVMLEMKGLLSGVLFFHKNKKRIKERN